MQEKYTFRYTVRQADLRRMAWRKYGEKNERIKKKEKIKKNKFKKTYTLGHLKIMGAQNVRFSKKIVIFKTLWVISKSFRS